MNFWYFVCPALRIEKKDTMILFFKVHILSYPYKNDEVGYTTM